MFFQVLVAPVVEKGAVQRDIYLPDGGFQWQDSQNAEVFDGGTFLQDYPVPLEDVAVFLRREWVTWLFRWVTWHILLLFWIKFLKKKLHVLFSTCTFPLKTIDSASRPFFLKKKILCRIIVFILALYRSNYFWEFFFFFLFLNFQLVVPLCWFVSGLLDLLFFVLFSFLYVSSGKICVFTSYSISRVFKSFSCCWLAWHEGTKQAPCLLKRSWISQEDQMKIWKDKVKWLDGRDAYWKKDNSQEAL